MECLRIVKWAVCTLALYASMCSCKIQKPRKTAPSMDDVFSMLLRGDGNSALRRSNIPQPKKQTKEVEVVEEANGGRNSVTTDKYEGEVNVGSGSGSGTSTNVRTVTETGTRTDTRADAGSGTRAGTVDHSSKEKVPSPPKKVQKPKSLEQQRRDSAMDRAFNALLGRMEEEGKSTSGKGKPARQAEQTIKPHNQNQSEIVTDKGDHSIVPDTEDHEIVTDKEDHSIVTDKEDQEIVPDNVTQPEIKRVGGSSDEEMGDDSDESDGSDDSEEVYQDDSSDIEDGKVDDELSSPDLVDVKGETEDMPIEPVTDHHQAEIADRMEDIHDVAKSMNTPGIHFDHSNNEERTKRRKRIYRPAEYKPYEPQVSVDPFNEEGKNTGLSAALRYLGSGYDIVFGNPIGDPTIMVDPGYRHPVLKLDWTEEYHNYDGANIKEPRGGWIRPELSCRQAESVDHVDTVEDYKKELSVDAQMAVDIPFYFSFSASAGYKNFVKTLSANVTKNYILKTYCLRYVAGINDLKNVDTTPSFKSDVAALPDYVDEEKCPMDRYRNSEDDPDCAASVRPWMKFFQKYGTHYTTIIHLGGKVTNQIQLKKSDVASLQKNGYNIDAVIKANAGIPFLTLGEGSIKTNGDTSSDTKTSSLNHEKLVIVIGGDVPTDGSDKVSMKEWTQSLYKKPMPIKVNLESIRTLIAEEKKKDAFDTALKYYSEIYGISPDEMYKTEGKERGIASLAMNGKVVVFEGKSGGSAVCPHNKVIMMGFALSITRKSRNIFSDAEYITSIAACPVGKEKCVASSPDAKADVRIWILCGEETIPLLIQETKVTENMPAVASCPTDYAIAFGFGMSIPKGLAVSAIDGYACRAGQSTCTHSSNKTGRNAVWIACVEKNAPELADITNYAVAVSTPACTKVNKETDFRDTLCPQSASLIAGWQMQIAEGKKDHTPKMATCSVASNGCKIDRQLQTQQSACKAHFSWVSCYTPSEFAIRRR